MTLPPLLRAGPQLGFAYALLGFTAIALRTAWQRFFDGNPLPALHMAMGLLRVFVVLVVLAVRRIGVRLFQRALPADSERVFLPRPPASRIAILSLLLATLAPWSGAPPTVAGWLSLAAGAAVFPLTGDWHLGRTLFHPRIFIFYLGLWGIALGHLGMGAGILLGKPMWTGAFRHVSVMPGIGLPVLGVLGVAGRAHTGHEPDLRP